MKRSEGRSSAFQPPVNLSLRNFTLDPYKPTEGRQAKSNDFDRIPLKKGKAIGMRALADQEFRALVSNLQ